MQTRERKTKQRLFVERVLSETRRTGRQGIRLTVLARSLRTGNERAGCALTALREQRLVEYQVVAGKWVGCAPLDDEIERLEIAAIAFRLHFRNHLREKGRA